MSDSLTERVENRLSRDEVAADAELVAAHMKEVAEANPYNQLTKLVVSEATDIAAWLIKRNHKQQRGWLIGDLLLRRNQPDLSLTSGSPHEWSSRYYVGVESPPVGTDADADIRYGWTFEMRSMISDGPRAFFSEVDANRPEHYWANYDNGVLYVNRVASSLANPEIEERELWYTVYMDPSKPLVIGEASIDEERKERQERHFFGDAEELLAINSDYPEMEAIREKVKKEMGPLPPGADPFIHSLTSTVRIRRLEEDFDKTPRGQERLKRIKEVNDRSREREEADGPYYRAGNEALQHCLGLMLLAKKELKIKT